MAFTGSLQLPKHSMQPRLQFSRVGRNGSRGCFKPFVPCPPQASPYHYGQHNTAAQASAGSAATTDRSAGRMTYKPVSYDELVSDAANSMLSAVADGISKMEVEFPPIPTSIDAYKGSSDVFIDANVQLALAGARKLAAGGKKVHLVMPDQGEYNRTYKMFKPSLELLTESVTLGHLKEGEKDMIGGFQSLLSGGAGPDSKEAGLKADVYIILNATCVELTNVQGYAEAESRKDKVFVLWNLELDTLRGDLGLLGYPSKDVHYKFLSYFKPVFYLRTRDYSKSVPVAPFIVNYSGALFREYPGPWQVMLKQDNGVYACIAEDKVRYNLGEVKEQLQAAMGLNTEEEGSAMQVLRRGLKNSTWWEDDYELEGSHNWRL